MLLHPNKHKSFSTYDIIKLHSKEWANNFLSPFIKTFDEDNVIILVEKMIEKMQLIAMMHSEVIENVDQAQIKHKHVYALRKRR
jgi:hypothetical protein